MSDPERFDGDDGLTLGHLSELIGPDYRAELAEFIAQVRYALDDYDQDEFMTGTQLAGRFRALVGKWPHEKDVGAFDNRSEWEPKVQRTWGEVEDDRT